MSVCSLNHLLADKARLMLTGQRSSMLPSELSTFPRQFELEDVIEEFFHVLIYLWHDATVKIRFGVFCKESLALIRHQTLSQIHI